MHEIGSILRAIVVVCVRFARTLIMTIRLCKKNSYRALSMLEMILALAIMAIVFTAIIPQFRNIQNSWASRQGNLEAIQNARILVQHINENISKAARVSDVSASSVAAGYIEFIDANDNTMRYELASNGYVKFGPVGNLADLAGPADELRFTCYDAFDLDTPTINPEVIRFVEVQANIPNSYKLANDKPITAKIYINANTNEANQFGYTLELNSSFAENFGLSPIDATHYLCTYTGPKNDGFATILTVDNVNWMLAMGDNFEFDTDQGISFPLCHVDDDTFERLKPIGPDGKDNIIGITYDGTCQLNVHLSTEKPSRAEIIRKGLARLHDGRTFDLFISKVQSPSSSSAGSPPSPPS